MGVQTPPNRSAIRYNSLDFSEISSSSSPFKVIESHSSSFICPQLDGNNSLVDTYSLSSFSPIRSELYKSAYPENVLLNPLSSNDSEFGCWNRIPVHISRRHINQFSGRGQNRKNLKSIRRNNKLIEAINLPKVITLNPRSLYNKKKQFCTLVDQMEADICFVSETWDISHLPKGVTLPECIQMENYEWVQNVVQRNRNGGKPAIFVSNRNFHITKICPEKVTVPVGVEIVWTLLTPKCRLKNTRVKHIAAASVYYSSKYTKKDALIDHISEAYHVLCSQYGSDLKFLICGDFNRLNIKPILNLSPDLRQVVKVPTRRNPDAILDLIITNIPALYESPTTLAPLENDDDEPGVPSDHLIVVMNPLTNTSLSEAKRYRIINYRPFPESGIKEMGLWLQEQKWNDIYSIKDPNDKAVKFEQLLYEKIDQRGRTRKKWRMPTFLF